MMVSPTKRELNDRQVAYHIGQIARDFQSGAIVEEDILNLDKIHLSVHLPNNCTLVVRKETKVEYADLVSCNDGIKMMVD